MSIEIVELNKYGEPFGPKTNVDDQIQDALDNPSTVRISDTQEVRQLLPRLSEVLFERRVDLDSLPVILITRTLTSTSTSVVKEIVSLLKQDPYGSRFSEVIYRATYHGNQINTECPGVRTPIGGTILFKYT